MLVSFVLYLILFLLLFIMLAIVAFLATYFVESIIYIAKGSHVPFVPTPRITVEKIVEIAIVTSESRVFDLGCGDARILCALARKESSASYFGIERGVIPYILARIHARGRRHANVKVPFGNFFNTFLFILYALCRR